MVWNTKWMSYFPYSKQPFLNHFSDGLTKVLHCSEIFSLRTISAESSGYSLKLHKELFTDA